MSGFRATMILGMIALAACASAKKESKPAAAAGDSTESNQTQLICTYEHSIGSNIPEKVCREPEDPPESAQGRQSQPTGNTTR